MIIIGSAMFLAFIHTVIGVDHFIPFSMIGRTRGWSMRRTLGLTTACGVGHIMSSVVIGFVSIALSVALPKVELIESVRGELAGWVLLIFGAVYAVWGAFIGLRKSSGVQHRHGLTTPTAHSHSRARLTPWTLFIIFVLGPCEVLIPFIMYPALEQNYSLLIGATLAFSLTTLGVMLIMVALSFSALRLIPAKGFLIRYSHCVCGCAIVFSGLLVKAVGI